MSEAYEGVVFCSDDRAARRAFAALASPLQLRLVRLDCGAFGIHRVASRVDTFDQLAVEQVAARTSIEASPAVALFYDNSCGVQVAVVYSNGRRIREFTDVDAWWVQLSNDGEPVAVGSRYRVSELHPDQEYDCVFSAIDAGLEVAGVSSSVVKQAFCYDEAAVLAEAPGTEPAIAPDHR